MVMGPAGGWGGGPSSTQSNANAGLPFAGVPDNLVGKVERVLRDEPEHPEPDVSFSPVDYDRTPFTLRSFLRPERRRLFVALALVLVETVSLQAGPLLTQIGIDRGIDAGDKGVLVVVTLAYFGSIIVAALTSGARIAYTGRLGERLMYQLRIRVFSHFQRQSLDFFTGEKAGVLMTRMTSDIDALTQLFQEGLINMAVQLLVLVVIATILFFLNPALAAITLLIVVPATLALTLWFRKVSDSGYATVRDRIADVLSDLAESLSGIRVIAAFNRRRHNVANHTNVVGEHLDANLYTSRAAAIYGPGSDGIGVVGQALLLAIGGRMVLNGSLTLGELFAFLLYLAAFFAPIQQLVQLYNGYQQGQAAVTKLRGLLDTEASVTEKPDAELLPALKGDITLEGVTFGYNPASPVLHEIDLHIAAGESLAVVGPTGAGKSTIAKLITRFYDPTDGRVLIDGHDLRDVTLHSLRSQLGVVPQEAFLFDGTIRDNVAFSRPDATDDEIIEACHAVGIDEVVARHRDGIDAPVHERGSSLSAGERQLLALARAFLARPRVLVLDEATSNLDLRSEAQIERALDAVLEGRTAIIIAHRLATAMRADRIAVVDAGRIVEIGSHDELRAAGGQYAAMYATWASHLPA